MLFAETLSCVHNHDHRTNNDEIGNETDLCAYLSVSNFAYPQWYPIPCNKSVYIDVICGDVISINSHNNMHLNLDSKIMCQSGWILFQEKCYRISRKRKRKFLVTNPEFHKKLKTDSLFMKFSTILEYMSKVNYKAPIFYFPASPEANQFYSLVDLPDINRNTTKLTFSMLPFDVCTDKGYAYLRTGRGRASPELVKLKRCIDNSTNRIDH